MSISNIFVEHFGCFICKYWAFSRKQMRLADQRHLVCTEQQEMEDVTTKQMRLADQRHLVCMVRSINLCLPNKKQPRFLMNPDGVSEVSARTNGTGVISSSEAVPPWCQRASLHCVECYGFGKISAKTWRYLTQHNYSDYNRVRFKGCHTPLATAQDQFVDSARPEVSMLPEDEVSHLSIYSRADPKHQRQSLRPNITRGA